MSKFVAQVKLASNIFILQVLSDISMHDCIAFSPFKGYKSDVYHKNRFLNVHLLKMEQGEK